jgi:two-component system C4-dicarboxylate transport response regulator DctD
MSMSQAIYDEGRVVIVEDDAVVRRLMRLWLEGDGYDVIELGSGREVAASDVKDWAMVCLDLSLEDMPGLEVLQGLIARHPDLPIIVVTGDQDSSTVEDAMRAGAYDYVVKPFDQGRLRHAVRRALERRQLALNVRRLREELAERADRQASGEAQGPADADAADVEDTPRSVSEPLDDGSTLNLRELERRAIVRALEVSGGSVGKAAKLLGIGRATLYRRLSEQRDPSRENGIGRHDIAGA